MTVAENLVGALEGMDEAIPNKSSFTRARKRLGEGVLAGLFARLAGPVAPEGLAGSFWRAMRLAAVDGFTLDLPDTAANREVFGGPVDNEGRPIAFPQARVVTLTECGTHRGIAASIGGFDGGEVELAVPLAQAAAGMLVIFDRGFSNVATVKAFTGAGAHVLIRASSIVATRVAQVLADGTYLSWMKAKTVKGADPVPVTVRVIEYRVDGGEVIRLITDLLDPDEYPAVELARLYGERWEAESANRQIKTFQRGAQVVLRSGDPELARQEVWAHLVIHLCLTQIIVRLASGSRLDPDRISFVKVLKHVQRSVLQQAGQSPKKIGKFLARIAAKVTRKLDNGPRRPRVADRLLKRPLTKYAVKTKDQTRHATRPAPPRSIAQLPRIAT